MNWFNVWLKEFSIPLKLIAIDFGIGVIANLTNFLIAFFPPPTHITIFFGVILDSLMIRMLSLFSFIIYAVLFYGLMKKKKWLPNLTVLWVLISIFIIAGSEILMPEHLTAPYGLIIVQVIVYLLIGAYITYKKDFFTK